MSVIIFRRDYNNLLKGIWDTCKGKGLLGSCHARIASPRYQAAKVRKIRASF